MVLETIQVVQVLIDKVTDENKKQELQNKLDKAQTLYNYQKLLAEVTVMVNGLFTDDSHTALKEGVTTEGIEKALGTLRQLLESRELMKLINKAYNLLENKSFTITNIDSFKAITDKTFKYYLSGLKATDKVEIFGYEYKKLGQMGVLIK
ncbi:toxin Cry1Ac domain D-VI-related protein [Enterococcus faecalis]|uniref:toxin Cry1Ac domain D-VI-related protein n=1 Tax=Enterococcus faecalis TaxID=1351 RepID=UPI002361B3D8|nr:toxin Cry1Ac domain D-VI-related protein [Enterococcus faecalis]MDD0851195.1 toxin Cry1Ac domain D-VI-related protein [Enterococcus faecalis]